VLLFAGGKCTLIPYQTTFKVIFSEMLKRCQIVTTTNRVNFSVELARNL
jgi:hypothetical protein